MALTRVSAKNFRAFPSFSFRITPLTILLGANGLGKTTLFHPILLLKQTMSGSARYFPFDLMTYGPELDLGGIEQVMHDPTQKTLEIGVSFRMTEFEGQVSTHLLRACSVHFLQFSQVIDVLWKDYFPNNDTAAVIERGEGISEFIYLLKKTRSAVNKTPKKPIAQKVSKKRYEDYVSWVLRSVTLGSQLVEALHPDQRRVVFAPEGYYGKFFFGILPDIVAELRGLNDIRIELDQVKGSSQNVGMDLQFEVGKIGRKEGFRLRSFDLSLNEKRFVQAEFLSGSIQLKSDVIRPEVLKLVKLSNLGGLEEQSRLRALQKLDRHFLDGELDRAISSTICKSIEAFKSLVDPERFAYIPSYRVPPSRIYPGFSPDAAMARMINLIEEFESNEPLEKEESAWWEQNSVLKFKASRSTDGTSLALKTAPPFGSSSGRAEKWPTTIVDTGFGFSQALPVTGQLAASSENATLIIEQPEAHLHPNLQAAIASKFYDAVSRDGASRTIIVETHSEHIVRRLQRLVFESQVELEAKAVGVGDRDQDALGSPLEAAGDDLNTADPVSPSVKIGELSKTEEKRRFVGSEQATVVSLELDPVSGVLQIDQQDLSLDFRWPEGFYDHTSNDYRAIRKALKARVKAASLEDDGSDESPHLYEDRDSAGDVR